VEDKRNIHKVFFGKINEIYHVGRIVPFCDLYIHERIILKMMFISRL